MVALLIMHLLIWSTTEFLVALREKKKKNPIRKGLDLAMCACNGLAYQIFGLWIKVVALLIMHLLLWRATQFLIALARQKEYCVCICVDLIFHFQSAFCILVLLALC